MPLQSPAPGYASFCYPCSEEETELEKAAAQWGKKHRKKAGKAARAAEFAPKQNVRKNRGRKR